MIGLIPLLGSLFGFAAVSTLVRHKATQSADEKVFAVHEAQRKARQAQAWASAEAEAKSRAPRVVRPRGVSPEVEVDLFDLSSIQPLEGIRMEQVSGARARSGGGLEQLLQDTNRMLDTTRNIVTTTQQAIDSASQFSDKAKQTFSDMGDFFSGKQG